MTGAIAMGVPGCPELAFWTASIANVRIVFMHSPSRVVSVAIYTPPSDDQQRSQELSAVLSFMEIDAHRYTMDAQGNKEIDEPQVATRIMHPFSASSQGGSTVVEARCA
jgi:hypothetical protein